MSIAGGADLRVDAMWTKQETAEIKPALKLRDEFEDLLQASLTDLRPLRTQPRLVHSLREEPIVKVA